MFTKNLEDLNTSEILRMFVEGKHAEIKPQKVRDIFLFNYLLS